jgi:hypothetical protein
VRVAEAAVAPLRDLQVEFMGVLNGMQTVRGVIEVDAHPDLVYKILTDYDRCSEVCVLGGEGVRAGARLSGRAG